MYMYMYMYMLMCMYIVFLHVHKHIYRDTHTTQTLTQIWTQTYTHAYSIGLELLYPSFCTYTRFKCCDEVFAERIGINCLMERTGAQIRASRLFASSRIMMSLVTYLRYETESVGLLCRCLVAYIGLF